jgi:choline dehydrogenase
VWNPDKERVESLIDSLSLGLISRRRFFSSIFGLGLAGLIAPSAVAKAMAANANQLTNRASVGRGYDYIIVGAGPAGCVLARRLVDSGAEVLLVEAGGTDQQASILDPSKWYTNIGGLNDWGHISAPAPQLNDRMLLVSSGKVLGGGSSINGSVWSRGAVQDFDSWAYEGCTGWSWKDVLPIYRGIENWQGGASQWRGGEGLMQISLPTDPHPAALAWLEASRQMGIPVKEDLCSGDLYGSGLCNLSVRFDGTRESPVRAYLRPVLDNPNLTLLLNCQATRLLFDDSHCRGVELAIEDNQREVRASREVLVTAGAIGSAKLLMLSGVGAAEELKRLDIASVSNLPGVGANLQDHPLLEGVILEYRGDMPEPRGNAAEATMFVESETGKGPNLQPVLIELPLVTPAIRDAYGNPPASAFTLAPGLVRTDSRGSVRLASADWRQKPLVDTGFMSEASDMAAAIACVELCRELGRQSAFDAIRVREVVPGKRLSQKQSRDFVRRSTTSYFHPAGTCRMGVDERAVVAPDLRVRGVTGLRICDSSVMPTITTGNTNAPTIMIAEKAAQMLLSAS